uniref:VLIG-type G domain-containing protein n=1 Tax=Strongyloides papillosus TaxID=174720 RepID=A0A0N5CBD8_STREA
MKDPDPVVLHNSLDINSVNSSPLSVEFYNDSNVNSDEEKFFDMTKALIKSYLKRNISTNRSATELFKLIRTIIFSITETYGIQKTVSFIRRVNEICDESFFDFENRIISTAVENGKTFYHINLKENLEEHLNSSEIMNEIKFPHPNDVARKCKMHDDECVTVGDPFNSLFYRELYQRETHPIILLLFWIDNVSFNTNIGAFSSLNKMTVVNFRILNLNNMSSKLNNIRVFGCCDSAAVSSGGYISLTNEVSKQLRNLEMIVNGKVNRVYSIGYTGDNLGKFYKIKRQ